VDLSYLEGFDMDQNRILELAIEQLQQKKAGIDAELEMIRAELNGAGAAVLRIKTDAAVVTGRRSRTTAEKAAQALRMRKYWAAKKGQTAKVATAPKATATANTKGRAKMAAEKKDLSLKLKAAWKRRKAAAAKTK
jgi:hypothetical protein